MTEPAPKPDSEDRRRPKAMIPYLALWGISLLCVIFALFAMLNRG
jgi:hypothetical protein